MKTYITLFLLITTLSLGSFAQEPVEPTYSVSFESTAVDTIYEVSCQIQIDSIDHFSKVHAQLIKANDGTNLLQQSFNIHDSNSLPQGMTFTKTGTQASIEFGEFEKKYLNVMLRLEAYDGSETVPVQR